jgi:NADPH-dependent curcumin reductase CurA
MIADDLSDIKTMWALGIGQVVGSSSDKFKVGSKVYGVLGMQEYALLDVTQGKVGPYEEALGLEHIAALGPAGNAAHLGLFHIANLKKGEVVLVSSAAGSTGINVSPSSSRV